MHLIKAVRIYLFRNTSNFSRHYFFLIKFGSLGDPQNLDRTRTFIYSHCEALNNSFILILSGCDRTRTILSPKPVFCRRRQYANGQCCTRRGGALCALVRNNSAFIFILKFFPWLQYNYDNYVVNRYVFI